MPFKSSDTIRYYLFESLLEAGVTHACFTRRGGASPKPWAALNLGGTVGDAPERVAENRSRALGALGQSTRSIYDVWQVHSRKVVVAQAPRSAGQAPIQADAILSDRPGLNLMMRFADCVPILLYEPTKKIIGIVHAGWLGTIHRVAEAAVKAMEAEYGIRAINILGAIGPSIGAHHYEVGGEVVEQVKQAFGEDAGTVLGKYNGVPKGSGIQFDLWEANRLILERAGLKYIEVSGLCTACDLKDWYSHRGESGITGRFGVMIGLGG